MPVDILAAAHVAKRGFQVHIRQSSSRNNTGRENHGAGQEYVGEHHDETTAAHGGQPTGAVPGQGNRLSQDTLNKMPNTNHDRAITPEKPEPRYPWWPYQALAAWESRVGQSAERKGGICLFLYEFVRFGVKQAWACLFGGLMLALLIGTHLWYPKEAFLPRYDFIVIASVLIQAMMLALRMETWEEAKVILLFHITGTIMEIFKTHMGSWQYPEAGYLKIGGVPVFSGFMYASVGSYIARVWRLFDFHFIHHPGFRTSAALSAAIYINFFTHHYFYDLRWIILAALAVFFYKTWIYFRIRRHYRRMPLLLGFFLTAVFIWFAENIATFANAWLYPNQLGGWRMVSLGKLVSWYMLMIISYVMVSFVDKPLDFRRDA